MYRICKTFHFEAAHVLEDAVSKCCTVLHGHSYTMEVYLACRYPDRFGMVVDFGALAFVKVELIALWDHSVMVGPHRQVQVGKIGPDVEGSAVDVPIKIIQFYCEPTAEVMAHEAYKWLHRDLTARKIIDFRGSTAMPRLEKVRIHETATGWAEWENDIHERDFNSGWSVV